MGISCKKSAIPDLKTNGNGLAKTIDEKMDLFKDQIKTVFATRLTHKDPVLEETVNSFLETNQSSFAPRQYVDANDDLLSQDDIEAIIKKPDIKKPPG